MIDNKRIFITGGAGFLGTHLINRYQSTNQVTVYSRDEAKHYYLKKEFPKVNFVVGDIRNYDLMKRASANHDIGIFAASLKQIEACHDNYEEANRVIVEGAFNSRRVAEENKFESACFISSDKSRAATTIYGAMKYVAGESFISNADRSDVRLSTVIYGNVANSTGSIIPLLWKSIEHNFKLQLYGDDMTRFIIDEVKAIDLIEHSLDYSGYNVLPKAESFKISDLFKIFNEEFGALYNVIGPRPGEKIHEIMASSEEIRRMKFLPDRQIYIMNQQTEYNELVFPNNEYSSRDCCITKDMLHKFLIEKNFYR